MPRQFSDDDIKLGMMLSDSDFADDREYKPGMMLDESDFADTPVQAGTLLDESDFADDGPSFSPDDLRRRLKLKDSLLNKIGYVRNRTKEDTPDAEGLTLADYSKFIHSRDFNTLDPERVNLLAEAIDAKHKDTSKKRGFFRIAADSVARGVPKALYRSMEGGMAFSGDSQEKRDTIQAHIDAEEEADIKHPRAVEGVKNIRGVGDAAKLAVEAVGENVGNAVAPMAAGAIGAKAGAAAGPHGAIIGGMVGAGVGAAAGNVGEAVRDHYNDTGRAEGSLGVWGQGLGYSAIDAALGGEATAIKHMVRGAADEALKEAKKNFIGSIGKAFKEVGKGAVKGGAGEVLQSQVVGRGRRYADIGSIFEKGESGTDALWAAADEFYGGFFGDAASSSVGVASKTVRDKAALKRADVIINRMSADDDIAGIQGYDKVLVANYLLGMAQLPEVNEDKQAIIRARQADIMDAADGETRTILNAYQSLFTDASFDSIPDSVESTFNVSKAHDSKIEEADGSETYFDPDSGIMIQGREGDWSVFNRNGMKMPLGEENAVGTIKEAIGFAQKLSRLNQWRIENNQAKSQVIQRLVNKRHPGANVVMIDTPQQAPQEARERMIGGEQGFYNASDNTVYIMLDAVQNPAQAAIILNHEDFHSGFEALMQATGKTRGELLGDTGLGGDLNAEEFLAEAYANRDTDTASYSEAKLAVQKWIGEKTGLKMLVGDSEILLLLKKVSAQNAAAERGGIEYRPEGTSNANQPRYDQSVNARGERVNQQETDRANVQTAQDELAAPATPPPAVEDEPAPHVPREEQSAIDTATQRFDAALKKAKGDVQKALQIIDDEKAQAESRARKQVLAEQERARNADEAERFRQALVKADGDMDKARQLFNAPESDPAAEPSASDDVDIATPDESTDVGVLTGTDGKHYPTVEVPLDELTLSKDVPQFKEGARSETGEVEPLKGKRYERVGTAPIVVWERKDGRKEIITGRHRAALARRTGEQTIPAQVVREADGFTRAQAITFDAESNIRDGQGSVKDYANYFRNSNTNLQQASSRGLLDRDKGRKGFAIGKNASPDLYALFRDDKIAESKAAAIAESAPDNPGAQQVGIRYAEKHNAEETRQYMRSLLSMRPPEQTGQQLDLLGFDSSWQETADKRAAAATRISSRLREELSALKAAKSLSKEKRNAIVKKYGVKGGNEQAISKRVDELELQLERFENWHLNPDLVDMVAREAGEEEGDKRLRRQGVSGVESNRDDANRSPSQPHSLNPLTPPQDPRRNDGSLFPESDIPFNLDGGEQEDLARIANEKRAAEEKAAEAKRELDAAPMLPGVEPAASSASGGVHAASEPRFRRRGAQPNDTSLVALHNITEQEFLGAVELGGFAMPSIAVTRHDMAHENFGDITLVFGRETIDPGTNRRNAVYSGDAWTPVFPDVAYELDDAVLGKIEKRLAPLAESVKPGLGDRVHTFIYNVEDIVSRRGGVANVIDRAVRDDGIRAAYIRDNGLTELADEKAFRAWLGEIFTDRIIKRRGIRNQRDRFTPSGTRRSFAATHDPYTLDNIVRAMAREAATGGGMGTAGDLSGAATRRFRNIPAVRGEAGRLQTLTEGEVSARRDEHANRMQEIIRKMTDGRGGYGYYNAGDVIVDAVRASKTPAGIMRHLQGYQDTYNVTPEIASEIASLAGDMTEMPVQYFEAKPQRAVGIDEIRGAVVPSEGVDKVKAVLNERGIPCVTYDKSVPGDRVNKVREFSENTPGIRFRRLAPNGQPSNLDRRQWEQVRTPAFKAWFGDWEAVELQGFLNGRALADLNTGDVPAGSYAEVVAWAADLFARQGGKAASPVLGDVALDARSAKDSMAHGGANRYKRAAFMAVKDVIERGRAVWMGEKGNAESYYICAPVDMDGERSVVTVLVRRDANTQRMYLHSVSSKKWLLGQGVSGASSDDGERSGSHTDSRVVARILHDALAVNPADVSKVVDANGEPLVLYHGGAVFSTFRKPERGDYGIYFTNNREFARNVFAMQTELHTRDHRGYEYDGIPEEMLDSGEWDERYLKYSEVKQVFLNIRNPRRFAALDAKTIPNTYGEGHDGIVVDNTDDFGYDASQVVVFEPNQIKSATDNTGAFSRDNPDIRFRRLAPNGQPSNLNERQWHHVRTPAFKDWFGDWENHPDGNIHFLDDNGEPRVFHHGTKQRLSDNRFKTALLGTNTSALSAKEGFFFAGDRKTSSHYSMVVSNSSDTEQVDRFVSLASEAIDVLNDFLPSFKDKNESFDSYIDLLNRTVRSSGHVDGRISRPFRVDELSQHFYAFEYEYAKYVDLIKSAFRFVDRIGNQHHADKELHEKSTQAFVRLNEIITNLSSMEISPVGNELIYDVFLSSRNPYVHDQKGEEYRESTFFDIIRKAKALGHDGVLIKNTFDGGLNSPLDDVAVVFDPFQIKSATDNSGDYSLQDEDIRFRRRTKPAPKKTVKMYKLMRIIDGKPHALFIGRSEPLEIGQWYDAESPKLKDLENLGAGYTYLIDADGNAERQTFSNKAQKPSDKEVDAATLAGKRYMHVGNYADGSKRYFNWGVNGAGKVADYALRPGWHATDAPSARQIGEPLYKNSPTKWRREDEFWTEIEVAADVDWQEDADKAKGKAKGIAEHIPHDGYYSFETNSTASRLQQWIIAGSIKINRILPDAEARKIVKDGGYETDWNKRSSGRASDDLRFRRSGKSSPSAAFLDTETRGDAIRRMVQDYMLPWSNLQKKLGGVADSADVYRAEDRSYGLQRNGIHQMDKTYIEPAERILIDNGISKEEFSQFLMAKAGPDRNKMIAERTNGGNLAGSGRTDTYWGNILNAYRSRGKLGAMMKAGQIVWDMNRHALDLKVAAGLMSRAQADVWKDMSPFYVPYRSDDSEREGFLDESKIARPVYSLRRKESMHATGRQEGNEADDPFAFSILQAYETVMRCEANRVRETAAKLIEAKPDANLYAITDSIPSKPAYNADTGKNTTVPDQNFETAPNVVIFKRGGKKHYMVFEGADGVRLARSLKKDSLKRATAGIAAVTRFMAATRTAFVPTFIIRNLRADLLQGALNMSSEGQASAIASVAKNLKPAWHAVWTYERDGKASGTLAKWANEYFSNGGQVAGVALESFADLDKSVEDRMKKRYSKALTAKGHAKQMLQYIERMNASIETGTRLAVYSALRENGKSVNDSIDYAKNVTVNFNRKGELSPLVNSWYMFTNVAVQDVTRTIKALSGKNGRLLVGSIMIAAFVNAMFNNMGDDDESEGHGLPQYKNISEGEKQRAILIRVPGGKYIKQPIRGIWGLLWYAGTKIGDVAFGTEKPAEAALQVGGALIDTVNFLGSSGSLAQLAAPSVADPVIQGLENKDFKGDPIFQRKFSDAQPDSATAMKRTPSWMKTTAKGLNSLTGGDDVTKGFIDVSPEFIQWLIDYVGGGTASDFAKGIGFGQDVAASDVSVDRTPFVRDVVRNLPDVTRRYYVALDTFNDGMYRMNHYETRRQKDKLAAELPYLNTANATRIKNLNTRIKDLRERETTDKDEGRRRHHETQRLRLQQTVVSLVEKNK